MSRRGARMTPSLFESVPVGPLPVERFGEVLDEVEYAARLVLGGDDPFFRVTKRLHNRLHGNPGDGGPLDEGARADYERITERAGHELREIVRPGDVVILHDPQTA